MLWLLVRLPIERSKTMKIKYQFNDEEAEIDVSDDWGKILTDLDR